MISSENEKTNDSYFRDFSKVVLKGYSGGPHGFGIPILHLINFNITY